MQVYFYTNKEKFIELFEWIKKEFPNIRYFDNTKNCLLDETEIYNGEPGYSKHIFLTDEYSTLYSKVRDNNSYDFPEEKYPLIFQNGMNYYQDILKTKYIILILQIIIHMIKLIMKNFIDANFMAIHIIQETMNFTLKCIKKYVEKLEKILLKLMVNIMVSIGCMVN